MSMGYWVINGVGIRASDIEQFINRRKVAKYFIDEKLAAPGDNELKEIMDSGEIDTMELEDFLRCFPCENLADILTFCDKTDSITYSEADGESYFYYPPSMPWYMTDHEPQSVQEVHGRIIAAVQKITDMPVGQIEKLIDDELYVVGCG